MSEPKKKRRGRPPRPLTPFERADLEMAGKLRPWLGWAGSAHCAKAAFNLSLVLAHTFTAFRSDPTFSKFRNAFRSYCNLWRGRNLGENWEVPENFGLESTLPSIENHAQAYQALGVASIDDMVKEFVYGQLHSFVAPKRKSASGKRIPIKVVLGFGPGEDPTGYGRKKLPVRYADAYEQLDILACKTMDTVLGAQMIAERMDWRGEDIETAQLRHELHVLYGLFTQLYFAGGSEPGSWCWIPEFGEIYEEIQPESGLAVGQRVMYWLIAFLRLRREAGGAANLPSLLYCEDGDCRHQVFYWPLSSPQLDGAKRKGKSKPPYLCPNHDPDEAAAWRKRRARAMRRNRAESKNS